MLSLSPLSIPTSDHITLSTRHIGQAQHPKRVKQGKDTK